MNDGSLLYTYYGDDFTGSTDVLEQLALQGVPAALFLTPPTQEQLADFPGLRAFGIAGDARSQTPTWMNEHLPPIFEALRNFGAPVTHYKVCSTFDSSPQIGNIGRAVELGLHIFNPCFVPIVVGAPHLRRYVMEGKLFAAAPDGMIHRIDRHPMSRHPVTPMREPDLIQHLALQTSERIGLMRHEDLVSLGHAQSALYSLLDRGLHVILFDTVDPESLALIGQLLSSEAKRDPLFSASSSGLTASLLCEWRAEGLAPEPPLRISVPSTSPLLVLSGSCSATTARQIEWSLANGFRGIRIEPTQWLTPSAKAYRHAVISEAMRQLRAQHDVVIYTAAGDSPDQAAGAALGAALGQLANDLLAVTAVRRIVFCGGDTSSHAVQQLGISALTWVASLDPGAPLCRTHRTNAEARPLELILKGGQVGAPDFFAKARGN
jgi:uncharacterized protein YgbK (DUF1537 family)